MQKKFNPSADYQPESFAFEDQSAVDEIIARYPKGRQQSATMPLLDLAQRQVAKTGPFGKLPTGGGWIPCAAMDEIARIVGLPPIKVYEVATFYSMYNLEPVGKYLIQFCTTTPCHLCGAGPVMEIVEKELGIGHGETTADGYFTLMEVECLGACTNAPMVQINDLFYEDLDSTKMLEIVKSLRKDVIPPAGPQNGRRGAMALSGPTSLEEQAKKAGAL